MFSIDYARKAYKFLESCDSKLNRRLKLVFDTLAQTPFPAKEFDFKKIEGQIDTYRIRISSYRIVYEILWQTNTIRVLKIERRDDSTYKSF